MTNTRFCLAIIIVRQALLTMEKEIFMKALKIFSLGCLVLSCVFVNVANASPKCGRTAGICGDMRDKNSCEGTDQIAGAATGHGWLCKWTNDKCVKDQSCHI